MYRNTKSVGASVDYSEKLVKNHFERLGPWFESVGFTINTCVLNYEDKYLYDDYYCKIVILSLFFYNL